MEGKMLLNVTRGWARRVIDAAFKTGLLVPRMGGAAIAWDDHRAPLVGKRIAVSAGRVDYNYTELTVDFSATARYPNEPVGLVFQQGHNKLLGSAVYPHLHWIQEEDHIPNWLMAFRWYKNGQLVPSTWTLAKYTDHEYTYASGALAQITNFPALSPPADETVSSILEVKLYRDSANASTKFAGADPYTLSAKAKEFDNHVRIDSLGSNLIGSKT